MSPVPVREPAATLARTREQLLADGVILCLRLDDGASDGATVVDACRAAAAGGLTVLEITLTTPGALAAIAALAREDGLLVGAGTVLEAAEVARVADAGGRFALSPVFDPVVVEAAERRGLLAIPGAATPAEILAAHRGGASLVKLFPAAALGGPDYLSTVRGPLPHVPLIPTSGPSADSLADYLAAGAVAVGVGREVFPPGFTPASVEAAARRVRRAMDRARGG